MRILLMFIVLIVSTLEMQAHRMLPLGAVIEFADLETGRELLGTEDEYTDDWSVFDIQSRLQDREGTKEELIKFGKEQVQPWTVEEEQRIRIILARIDSSIRVNNYYWPLPQKIYLLKSTLLEEGGAIGYTRKNYIVLRQDVIMSDESELQHVILHEIFHILTRSSPDYRARLYNIIGFTVDNPIPFPSTLKDLRITNPDAHTCDSYIRLMKKDSTEFDALMIIHSDRPWEGGMFFQYLQIGFVEITGEAGSKEVLYMDGRPKVWQFKDIIGFFEQVGANTQYVIDPEEIMADNFSYVIMNKKGLPSQNILDQVRTILQNH